MLRPWSRGLIARLGTFALAVVLIGLPLQLMRSHFSPWWLLLSSVLGLWSVRLLRKLMVASATSALARGDSTRARRLYRLLWVTSWGAVRQACALSLAACDAADEVYEKCLERLDSIEVLDSEESLQAVAYNLRAYCYARLGCRLDEALRLAQKCMDLRSQVQGFQHTRGLALLELGRYEEAIFDLEAAWSGGKGAEFFESERCFDLGRLWALRGHGEYAVDYHARALRACPEGRWAEKARLLMGASPNLDGLEVLGEA